MNRGLAKARRRAIKKAPAPHMGQERCSCDTTQIDEKSSTRFTHHHAHPMDNGLGSRRLLLGSLRSGRPQKSIHLLAGTALAPFAARFDGQRGDYFSSSTVYAVSIAASFAPVKRFLKKSHLPLAGGECADTARARARDGMQRPRRKRNGAQKAARAGT